MWIVALICLIVNALKPIHFAAISISIIFLILINPPTLLILKRLKTRRLIELLSIFINLLEILGYTSIIYFLGGMEAAYLTPLYSALIIYIGVVAPRRLTFIVTTICATCFSFIVLMEYFGFLPSFSTFERTNLPFVFQITQLFATNSLLFVVGFISSYAAQILRQSKKRLSEKNFELQKATRYKSEFLANMSHELRTPLNHIIGFTDLLLSRNFGELNAKQDEFLKDVVGSGHHLLSLVNDILDLSKVEAGKMELELAEVRIRELLEGSLVMVKEKALKHHIRLVADLDGLPEVMLVDERKIKQVVCNLLSNAVKFTPVGGEVRLGAKIEEGSELGEYPISGNGNRKWLCVWVSDTGIGLEQQDLARIFNPFEQVEGSASRKYKGTGLGLSLSRRMVELHTGAIWAESSGAGKGSTFRFAVPVLDALEISNDCVDTLQAGADSSAACFLLKRDSETNSRSVAV
jgi:signal transduction histidine kinase